MVESYANGIGEIEKDNIEIFPNPIAEVLNIKTEFRINKIELLDLSGTLLIQETINKKSSKIDVRSIKSGLYFLKITSESGTDLLRKILIE